MCPAMPCTTPPLTTSRTQLWVGPGVTPSPVPQSSCSPFTTRPPPIPNRRCTSRIELSRLHSSPDWPVGQGSSTGAVSSTVRNGFTVVLDVGTSRSRIEDWSVICIPGCTLSRL